MLGEIAINIVIEDIIKSSAKFFLKHGLKIGSTAQGIEIALATHLDQLNNWSKEISFNDLKKSKLTSNVFINIDILLMPRKSRISSKEKIEKISCAEIFTEINKHVVILGQPGAGKTTLVKHVCQSIMLDENFYPTLFKFPIIIRLRELTGTTNKSTVKNPIINYLFNLSGLVLDNQKKEAKQNDILLAKEKILFPLLENLCPLIILDGYDEISTTQNREEVINDFRKLTLSLNKARVLLTSRTSDYNYSVENTSVLEICSLSEGQIKEFSLKWLEDSTESGNFLKSLKESPFADTAIRPLTLSHLCAIYERIGKIPDKPKTVYKKIINLLLEEWDEQRFVKRTSGYADFEIDRKFEFLCRLAYEVTIDSQSTIFNKSILKNAYNKMYIDFGLGENEAGNVIKELESHTGLIIKSGYDDYEFAHKSIHEYLCAEHLVKLPIIPKNEKIILLLPNELAIATTISSDPSLYFCELVNRFITPLPLFRNVTYNSNFISAFVNRLVLEKPNFNFSENISFALVVLYTLFRRTEKGNIRFFENDLPIQFEKFTELIFMKNNKFQFQNYYELDEKYKSEQNNNIYKLIKMRRTDFTYKGHYHLPEFLFVRDTFVSGFDDH